MTDHFRPHFEPQRTLYDALVQEAEHREGRTAAEWIAAERAVVFRVATEYAEKHDLRFPTLDDVKQAERLAVGHVDYAAKWAIGIADAMPPRLFHK